MSHNFVTYAKTSMHVTSAIILRNFCKRDDSFLT